MSAYTAVRAESHDAAAKPFERHPYLTIFPRDSVEVSPADTERLGNLLMALGGPAGRAERCPLLGVKQTLCGGASMSAYDPKRTLGVPSCRTNAEGRRLVIQIEKSSLWGH
jgi:hypothetical protein